MKLNTISVVLKIFNDMTLVSGRLLVKSRFIFRFMMCVVIIRLLLA